MLLFFGEQGGISMVVEIENTPGRYVARQLNITDKNKRGAIERLSSGYRVNKAADDV